MKLLRSLVLVCPLGCLLAQSTPQSVPMISPPSEFATPGGAKTVPPDRVVIRVGNNAITAAEFEDMVNALPPQYQATTRGVGRKAFADSIVKILILSDEAKRRKLDQDPVIKSRINFDAANILANAASDRIQSEINPGEPELRAFYEQHKKEFERVKARHILVRFKGSGLGIRPGQPDLTEAEALAKAQELRKRLVAGEDFDKVARVESDDPGAANSGGDLGMITRGQMVPAFDEAAFALNPGEVSQPVKSQFGFHVIKVEAREVKTLAEVRGDLERRIKPEMATKFMHDLESKNAPKLDPEFFNLPKQ